MFKHLQKEHTEWADRHSARLTPVLASLGVLEEACELLRAAAKLAVWDVREAVVRYTREQLLAMYSDAVGDCAIYCLSRCTALDVDFRTAVRHAGMPPKSEPPLATCCRVLDAAWGIVEAPQDRLAVVWVLSALQDAAVAAGVSFESCVLDAWAVVRERSPDRP